MAIGTRKIAVKSSSRLEDTPRLWRLVDVMVVPDRVVRDMECTTERVAVWSVGRVKA